MDITIQFSESASPRFDAALQEARKNPTFAPLDKAYSVTYRNADYRSLHLLLGRLKYFRNKRVLVGSEELPWDEVFHYLPCHELRSRAYDPGQYCHGDSRQFPAFNPWGCIQAMMPLSNDAEWLRYGKFDPDGTWIFDKERIEHCLVSSTHRHRFCPVLDLGVALGILKAFPETVNPARDRDWEYADIVGRRLSVGMEVNAGAGAEKKYACGVKPSSPQAIKNICRKILGGARGLTRLD